jgi:hypothetical protein
MDLNTWLIYLLAAIGLSLSPGPNGLLNAWGIARSAQSAVHHFRRRLRFHCRRCAFHVWHRRVAPGFRCVADHHEVGGRCLPRLARHSSLPFATDGHRSLWFNGTQNRLVAVPARSTLRADESQRASLLRCFSSAVYRPCSKSFRPVRHHGWIVRSNRNSYGGAHRQHGSSHQPVASASWAALQPSLRRSVYDDRGRTAPSQLSVLAITTTHDSAFNRMAWHAASAWRASARPPVTWSRLDLMPTWTERN